MKWFKHYCNSLSDPFIQELIDEFSGNGYLAWFGLIELIGEDNGHILTGKLEVKPSFLKRKLHISTSKLEVIYRFCEGKGKVSLNFSEVYWKFSMPKIVEIKDNYTKDLQETCNTLSNHKEGEKEGEKEGKYDAEKPFEEIWQRYPVKDGKKYAYKHFKATIKNDEDVGCINSALDKYLAHLALPINSYKKPKNGKTWFNNWEDWENWEEPIAISQQGHNEVVL